MKLGILKTDEVREELSGQFGEYPEMFSRLFQTVESRVEISSYDVKKGEYPGNIDEVDAYLITGSSASVYEKSEWIQKLGRFIKVLHIQQKKTIGICFGHQLVAQVLGGKTEKASSGWNIGTQAHQLNEKAETHIGHKDSFNLIFSHQDQVVVPAIGSEILANTEFCSIAMCKIEEHILTIQGHPEFEKEYAVKLMGLRRQIFGENLYQRAIESLERSNDRLLVAKLMAEFIKKDS